MLCCVARTIAADIEFLDGVDMVENLVPREISNTETTLSDNALNYITPIKLGAGRQKNHFVVIHNNAFYG